MTGFFVCPACAAPTFWGSQCGSPTCRRLSSLDGLISAASYAEPRCRELLHQYKYEGVDEAGRHLAALLREFVVGFKYVFAGLGPATVVGLPLHPFRLARRGFNQAAVFGRVLAMESGLPYESGLVKRKFSRLRQVQMRDELQRRKNAELSFSISKFKRLPDRVILVDDVHTTGATLNACASALKARGVKAVWGVTVLRG